MFGAKYNNFSCPERRDLKVPGSLEHAGVVSKLIKEAWENRGDLVGCGWLSNANGSIPYKLVEGALNWHHVPGKFRDLILDYYNKFSLRVHWMYHFSDPFCSSHENDGEVCEVESRGPLTNSGI